MFIEDTCDIYSKDGNLLFNFGVSHLTKEDSANELGHCHTKLELNYIKSGKGKYFIDEKFIDIIPGDIFILNDTEFHRVSVESEELVLVVVHFEPQYILSDEKNISDYQFLAPFFNRSKNFENRLNRNSPVKNELQKLFVEIEEEAKNKPFGYNLFLKSKLLTILSQIVRYTGYVEENDNYLKFSKHDMSIMKQVKEYINLSLSEEISIEKIASDLHMSSTYFSTLFKKINGISPIQYIIKSRIGRAINLLEYTDKSILDIAELCGFNNIANFYKVFKKVTGHVPTYYRTHNTTGEPPQNEKADNLENTKRFQF